MTSNGPRLRFVTYLSPSVPVEYFELLMHYLEEVTGCETSLVYESRYLGPVPGKHQPFEADLVDIAFLNGMTYMNLCKSGSQFAELLPVGAVTRHPKNTNNEAGYFSDILISRHNEEHFQSVTDLHGCKWTYNQPHSLSGNIAILRMLKKMGENAAFFGNTIESGTHLNSIKMVALKQADAAAVDSFCLSLYLQEHPHLHDSMKVLTSLGPLPPHPIMVNARLPVELKEKIISALLDMHNHPQWGQQLYKYHVNCFKRIEGDLFQQEADLRSEVKDLSISTIYY